MFMFTLLYLQELFTMLNTVKQPVFVGYVVTGRVLWVPVLIVVD